MNRKTNGNKLHADAVHPNFSPAVHTPNPTETMNPGDQPAEKKDAIQL